MIDRAGLVAIALTLTFSLNLHPAPRSGAEAGAAAPMRYPLRSNPDRAKAIGIDAGASVTLRGKDAARDPGAPDVPALDIARDVRLERWRPLIAEASERFSVPAAWIARVMIAESAGMTHRGGTPIRSRKGTIGLMQLMPGTWREMRTKLGLGNDPDDPRDNILAGTFYLRILHDRFGYPGLFAAYNAGPARYERYLAGTPLPAETRVYLARTTSPGRSSAAAGAGTYPPTVRRPSPAHGATLFAATGDGARLAVPAADPAADPADRNSIDSGPSPGPVSVGAALFAVRKGGR